MRENAKPSLSLNGDEELPGLWSVPTVSTNMKEDKYSELLLRNERAWISIAKLFLSEERVPDAIYSYERALSNNPLSLKALQYLAPIYRRRGRYREALDMFLRMYKTTRESTPDVITNIAYCYLMTDQLEESYRWYRAIAESGMSLGKSRSFFWFGVGVLYERFNNLQVSEEALAAAAKINPVFEYATETYFRLGVLYKERRAFQMAMNCFKYLLNTKSTSKPTKEDVLIQIAQIHELQEQNAEAVEILEDVLLAVPGEEKASMFLAWIYYKQRKYVSCAEALKQIHSGKGMNAFSSYMLGRCYQMQGFYKNAYDAYCEAIEEDRTNAMYLNSMGTLYFMLSQFEDALRAFKKATSLDPHFAEAWCNLAVLYEQFEETSGNALLAHEHALRLRPGDPRIIRSLQALQRRNSSECKYTSLGTLRDIQPNPGRTPYFTAHVFLGHRPTGFRAFLGEAAKHRA
jgi:general transcriptional corepressor CYC8